MNQEVIQELCYELKPDPHFYRAKVCSWGIVISMIVFIFLLLLQILWWVVMTKGEVENQAFPYHAKSLGMEDIDYSELCEKMSYTGETRGGVPHGEGKLTILWTNGKESSYYGSFRNGVPCGKGRFYYSDGTSYASDSWEWREDPLADCSIPQLISKPISGGVGMYADGAIHGLYFAKGILCQQGEWVNGHLNGYGSMCYDARETFSAYSSLSVRSFVDYGTGEYFWQKYEREKSGDAWPIEDENVVIYKGYLKDNKPHAFAEIIYNDGGAFDGVVDENATPIFGSRFLPQVGSYFMGGFDKYGHPNFGAYFPKEVVSSVVSAEEKGETFEWRPETRIFTWDDDIEDDGYKGLRVDGKKEGLGLLEECESFQYLIGMGFPSYLGEFCEDEINGAGILSFKNAPQRFEGYFENGEFRGEGIFYYGINDEAVGGISWSSGETTTTEVINGIDVVTGYTGMFLDGQRNGQGIMMIEDGTTYGTYTGAMLHGYPYGYGRWHYMPAFWKEDNETKIGFAKVIEAVWSWTERMVFEDGIYAGMLADGQRCGYGILIRNDNTVEAGVWQDGELVYPEKE